MRLVRQSAKRKKLPAVLSAGEVRQLIASLGLRERTLVLLDAGTGLRMSELFARCENTGGNSASWPGASDQDAAPGALDNTAPNRYFGPSVLDRTHQISFAGYADLPAGFQISLISHFWSPLAVAVVVPNTNLGPGEISRTDFTGDGTVHRSIG
jgi:hypothetical protein